MIKEYLGSLQRKTISLTADHDDGMNIIMVYGSYEV